MTEVSFMFLSRLSYTHISFNDRKMENNSSQTTLEINKFSDGNGWYWFRVFFITITAFLDIICIIVSLIVLPKMKSLPSNNWFLVTISSVLDLATGFVVSFSIAPAILGSWPYGQQMCLIYIISGTSLSCTAVILVIGALDRYVAIKKPLHYHLIVTKTRLRIICFVSILITLASMLFWFLLTPFKYNYNLYICAININTQLVVLSVIHALFHGMNLLIVVFVYVQLFRVARAVTLANRVRNINDNNNNCCSNAKAVRMLFVYSGTYVCAILPFTMTTFSMSSNSIKLPYQFEFFSVWFMSSYPWWNVAGLAVVNSNFRQLMFETLCRRTR